MTRTITLPKQKPQLRGVFHQIAAVVALFCGTYFVYAAPSGPASWGAAIYVGSVICLFAVSAVYHRATWQPQQRQILRRVDHSAIFLLIAGTYTPLIFLIFPPNRQLFMLLLIWSGASLGILQSIFWPAAPKWLVALLCVALGWLAVFQWDIFRGGLGFGQFIWLAGGGVLYTLGALIYAMRWPNPWPTVCGYHELFHALTIFATVCHWTVISQVVLAA